jgi:hypothetical protein
MMLSSDDLKKIQALAKLAGEGVSATVRAAINREYHAKIVHKRQ